MGKSQVEESQVSFPLRVACADAGSNAIRFLVVEAASETSFAELASVRVPVRLGHGVFLHGKLSEEAMDRALKAFRSFRELLDTHDVPHFRAVATSAVRESANGPAFLKRVRKQAGVSLEAITGAEEARLAHLAIRSRVSLGREQWVLADLGGGSVEVSLVDGSGTLWSESHTMGSVRLLEELSGAAQNPGRFRQVLSEYVATLRIPSAAQYRKPSGFIATGGNIESLARLAGAEPDARGVSLLALPALRSTIDSLSRLSFRRRVEELGLREDRADVILPAAMVYERLAVLAGADAIHVPFVGVKEGVILDILDSLAGQRSHAERQENEVFDAALTLGRRYMFDEAHGVHVVRMAREIFDQLRDLHGLRSEDRRLLVAAALLHDIGRYISYKKHHRHSSYLIEHSEIAGLSPREILVVAAAARYHRKSDPAPEHVEFARLSEEEGALVTRLAAILRIADGLDREHRQTVRGLRINVDGDSVVLEPESDEDILLERWSLRKRSGLFKKAFGKAVKIRTRVG